MGIILLNCGCFIWVVVLLYGMLSEHATCLVCQTQFVRNKQGTPRVTCSQICHTEKKRRGGLKLYWADRVRPEPKKEVILTEAQKGYIAGILDGEGWLGITARKPLWKNDPNQPHYHRPAVTIAQCVKNKVLLDHIADILGHKDFGYNREQNCWTLRLHAPCIRWLLPQLVDHLVLKRQQAEILIEFTTQCHYHGRALSQEDWEKREALRQKIVALNAKLPNPNKLRD